MSTRQRDRGSSSLELVLLTPAVAVGWLLIVWAGRIGHDQNRVRAAAERGARAASMASAQGRVAAATSAALDELAGAGAGCIEPSIAVASTVASVQVTVTCRLDTTGLPGFGSRTFAAFATSPIDRYRVA